MTSSSKIIVRKPYQSGNSTVVTVSGIPLLNGGPEIAFKLVELDGDDFILATTIDKIGKYEFKNMSEHLSKYDTSNAENILKANSKEGAKKLIDQIKLDDNQSIKLIVE